MVLIERGVDITSLTTFRVPVRAEKFVVLSSTEDLLRLIDQGELKTEPFLFLGGGSNVLFINASYKGLILHNRCKGIRTVREDADRVSIKVSGGENWHELVLHCLDQGWGGIENLSLIPGTVGAAPIQNIGAYGVELKDVLEQVEAIELQTGRPRIFSLAECQFGYRDSYFKQEGKGKYFISSVTLSLTKRNHTLHTQYGAIRQVLADRMISAPTIRDIGQAVISIRQSKLPDPSKIGNAGSFFKNPTVSTDVHRHLLARFPELPGYSVDAHHVKVPAGWLIERCGFKGVSRNHVGVHKDQALVLVNLGEGTGREILSLAEEIMAAVRETFAIQLTPEVNVI